MKKTCHPVGRVLTILFTLASLGTLCLTWVKPRYPYLYPLNQLIGGIRTHGFGTMLSNPDNLVFLLSFALLALTALLTVILAAVGSRGAGAMYFPAAVLAFCVILYAAKWNFGDLGLGAWLCVACAALGLCFSYLAEREESEEETGFGKDSAPEAGASSRRCPQCGTLLANRERFCPQCGAARNPEGVSAAPRRCGVCGTALRPCAVYCPNCGRLLEQPEPARKPFCGFCGKQLEPGMAFCPACGTAVGAYLIAPENKPEEQNIRPAKVVSILGAEGEDRL